MANSDKDRSIYHKFSRKSDPSEPAGTPSASFPKMAQYQQLQRRSIPQPKSTDNEEPCRVPVTIGGMQYRLMAPDRSGEKYIKEIADKADQMIRQILKNSPGMSLMNVTVLSLVNALDELRQRETQTNDLEQEITQYSSTIESNKVHMMHLREINWELKKEVLRLQSIIDSMENDDAEAYANLSKQHMLPLEELAFDVLEEDELETDDE